MTKKYAVFNISRKLFGEELKKYDIDGMDIAKERFEERIKKMLSSEEDWDHLHVKITTEKSRR